MGIEERFSGWYIGFVFRTFRAALIGIFRLTWWFLKAVYHLPRTLRMVWFEARYGVQRCVVCEADLAGTRVCEVCATDQQSDEVGSRRTRFEDVVTAPPPPLPFKFYDLARRISLASSSFAIFIAFLLMSVSVIYAFIARGAVSGFSAIPTAILTSLALSAPALYFMSNRWALPFDLKRAGIWAAVSCFLVFGFFRDFFASTWIGISLLVLMLATLVLVGFQVLFPFFLRRQRQRWEQFFSASSIDIGFSGRPGSSLSLSGLDEYKISIGQQGEQLTAEKSRGSLDKKSILFNSLIHPEHQNLGDLDHALLVGDKLILVDTKRWRADSYSTSQGNVLRDGEPFDGGNISLGKWIEILGNDLRDLVTIEGYVVMTNPSSILSGDGQLSSNVHLTTLKDFQELLQNIAESNEVLPPTVAIQFLTSLLSEDGVGIGKRQMILTELDLAMTSRGN